MLIDFCTANAIFGVHFCPLRQSTVTHKYFGVPHRDKNENFVHLGFSSIFKNNYM